MSVLGDLGTAIKNKLALKANIASPTFTGVVTAPTFSGSLSGNATTAGGLAVATGTNNVANQIVRTDGNGYIQCGYIQSSGGNEHNNVSPSYVWGTNGSDNYMRTYNTGYLSVNYANSSGSCSGNAATATTASNATKLNGQNWYWSGQNGQPSWLWGGSDGTNMYVYNPSNFSVNYANSAGSASTITGLSFGSIGSVLPLMCANNTNYTIGSTVAGSALRYGFTPTSAGHGNMTFKGHYITNTTYSGSPRYETTIKCCTESGNATYNGGGTALSGTWVKLDINMTYYVYNNSYGNFYYWGQALWQRIA